MNIFRGRERQLILEEADREFEEDKEEWEAFLESLAKKKLEDALRLREAE